MTDTGQMFGALRVLNQRVDELGKHISSQGAALQKVVDSSANKLSAAADDSTKKLVSSLVYAANAAESAARASTKHARNLAFATWALAVATVVLVVVTAIHH